MSIIKTREEVTHANGNKTIYHKLTDTSQPKVRIAGFNYLFNSHIEKIEYNPARIK